MKNVTNIILAFSIMLLAACSEEKKSYSRESGFEDFVTGYNSMISDFLAEEMAGTDERVKKLNEERAVSTDEKVLTKIDGKLNDLVRLKKKIQYRIDKKEFISIKTEQDLPKDLAWENGADVAEKGDARAKKGGVFHDWIPTFPPTIRPVGPNANNSFRGYMHDYIYLALLGYDSLENKFYPALASEWAYGADGQTLYYKIDPKASFSDGVPVTANDFITYLYIRLSDNITAPYQKQYFKNQFANFTTYGDRYLSISLPEKKPMLAYFTNIPASPTHFYNEYGPDYDVRYQWRVPPTTGAYTVLDGGIKKGRSITLSRVKDWWAKDMKHFKYSYNVDKIVYTVIGEKTKAFELFKMGKLDAFLLGEPDYWYEKMEVPQFYNGYIEKAKFYTVFPRVPRGLFLNVHEKPLDDINVRRGIAHAMNFDKANTVIFRGDSERLQQFSEGFGEITNRNVKARDFSIKLAQDFFAKAGYDILGSDGILENGNGEKLNITLSWGRGRNPSYDRMMEYLKENAEKIGLGIQLDGQQNTVFFRNAIEKRHQMCFSGWSAQPPFPNYFQFFHSSNAYDEKGNVKKQTNNLNNYADPKMDKLAEISRGAQTLEELTAAAHEIQQIIHDEAIFIPALKTPYVRMGYWRWLQWPQTKYTEFSQPVVYIPTESYSYWIDPEIKKETLNAMRSNKTFPEKEHLFDLNKEGLPSMEILEKRTPTQP
jgi:microcin C transport system substrate-binding protein